MWERGDSGGRKLSAGCGQNTIGCKMLFRRAWAGVDTGMAERKREREMGGGGKTEVCEISRCGW